MSTCSFMNDAVVVISGQRKWCVPHMEMMTENYTTRGLLACSNCLYGVKGSSDYITGVDQPIQLQRLPFLNIPSTHTQTSQYNHTHLLVPPISITRPAKWSQINIFMSAVVYGELWS